MIEGESVAIVFSYPRQKKEPGSDWWPEMTLSGVVQADPYLSNDESHTSV
jgi:hypothetical protein